MATNNHGKIYVNANGKQVLRISEVIKMLGKEQIAIWANLLGFKKISYKEELNRTAMIGSMVHGILEDFTDPHEVAEFNQFEKYNIHRYSDQLEVLNALSSFFIWYSKNEELFQVVKTECTMIGEEVGGTTDLILQSPFHKDRVIIGDYKTAKAVYLSMFLQVAGYIYLYEEINGKDTCDGAVIFQLDKKHGECAKPKFINRKKMQRYVDAFLSLLKVAQQVKSLENRLDSDMEIFTVKNIL